MIYVFLLGTWWQNLARGRVVLGVLAGLAVAISLIYGAEWTSIFIYVSAAAGFIIWDRRRAMLAVGAVHGRIRGAVGDRAHHVR